jgi:tetratricopeptide (TPR) repeat protein
MSKRKIGVNPTPEKKSTELFTSTKLLSRNNLIAIAVIITITILLFWEATSNGFTDWDDDLYVVNSELIKTLGWDSLISYFTTFTANLYTPLVTLSYAIDYQLYGMIATGFHGTNLFLHVLNSALVFMVTFVLFKRTFVAALTALLFSIHPLQTEAVVWISSRKDLLFTFFYLLGIIAYVRYKEKQKILLLILTFLLFILSVLSKPIAFTFPFALLWIDFFQKRSINRRDVMEKIPFVLVSVAVGILGIYLVSKYEVFATAPEGYTIFDIICLAGYSLAFYFYNAFIPTELSNYHAYPYKIGTLLEAQYILAPVLVLILLFVIYKSIRKNFILVSGVILFLIIIGPTLRLLPTGYPVAADRYFYLASIGLFWTVILVFEKIAQQSFALKSIVVAISAALVLAFVVVTSQRIPEWKDSHSLWTSALKKDPYHELANDHLGKMYEKAGNKDLALVHFKRVVDIDRNKYDVMNSMGNIYVEKKQPQLAMQYYNMAIATGKADHLPYYNRGMVYSEQNEFSKAITDFNEALKRKVDFAEAYNNRGIAKVKSGDTVGALSDFTEAARLKPQDQMMQDNLTRIKLLLNQ